MKRVFGDLVSCLGFVASQKPEAFISGKPLEIVSAYIYPGDEREIFQSPGKLSRESVGFMYADFGETPRIDEQADKDRAPGLDEATRILMAHVSHNNGRLVSIDGYAILAEFSNIDRALRCAINLLLAARKWNADLPFDQQLLYRMCLSYGESFFGRNYSDIDYRCFAAYRSRLASAGGICISRTLRENLERHAYLKLVGDGKQFVKNIKQPVESLWIEIDIDPWTGHRFNSAAEASAAQS